DRLREQREKKRLTQRELADLCGITMFQISRYETGKSDATGATLAAMAMHLGVSVDYLLGLTDYDTGFRIDTLRGDQSRLLEAYEAGDSTTVLELLTARVRQLEGEKGEKGEKYKASGR